MITNPLGVDYTWLVRRLDRIGYGDWIVPQGGRLYPVSGPTLAECATVVGIDLRWLHN